MTGDLQPTRIAVEPALIPVVDDAQAIEACLRARADQLEGADRLRRVITAGRFLKEVARNPGTRALSTDFTRLKTIIKKAGISRQTAFIWQRAAEFDDSVVEIYIRHCVAKPCDVTVSGLLQFAWKPKPTDARGSNNAPVDGKNPPTHKCPACGCLVSCDRDER